MFVECRFCSRACSVAGWLISGASIPPGRTLTKAWPLLLLAAVVWGAGEIAGYACGIGLAQERTLRFDTNRARYLNRRDRQLFPAA